MVNPSCSVEDQEPIDDGYSDENCQLGNEKLIGNSKFYA